MTQYIEIDGGAQDDAWTTVSGGFGSLHYQQSGGTVMSGWDDKTPTAWEEVWDVAELGNYSCSAMTFKSSMVLAVDLTHLNMYHQQ